MRCGLETCARAKNAGLGFVLVRVFVYFRTSPPERGASAQSRPKRKNKKPDRAQNETMHASNRMERI